MRTSLFSWLFIASILSQISIDDNTNVAFGQCLGSQQLLLLNLKSGLSFDFRSTKLTNWSQSHDCCSWKGVLCDDQGHVTNLDLSAEGISGELDNMTSLFSLNHLKTLDLSFNYGSSIVNVAAVFRNFPELEQLFLDGVNMSESGAEWGRALSSSLLNLRVLSLSKCYLSGPLDDSLAKLQSLSVIHLQGNNFSSPVPESFAKLSNLTSLKLESCELRETFPREVFEIPTLQTIDISYNEFLRGSLPEFPLNSALRYIDLSNTKFSGTLPLSIGNLRNLSTLFLSNCRFHGTIPTSIEKLTQLFYVSLSSNSFTGTVPSFSLSKNLSRLSLFNNSLTGEISSTHWKGLTNLESIYMSSNLLTGNIPLGLFALPLLQTVQLSNNQFIGSIPEFEIASSSVLNTLDLSHNNVEGLFPISVFKLTNLYIFDLSYNKFNGTVELNMFQRLEKLIHLDLSYNKLSLVSNASDYSFTKIRDLLLSACNLETFPKLKNLSDLVSLDLSNNRISGEIPKWIWELGNFRFSYLNLSHNDLVGFQEPYYLPNSLNVLDMHFNKLRGKTPTLPQNIHYVDLSSNKFESIQADIFKGFLFLNFFSLSNNSLLGTIPESICKASTLGVLDLSHNNLSGEIPACLIKISNVTDVLNLRDNNFSGSIPDEFPSSCKLSALDLNGNSLVGEIPKSLTSCSHLSILDLGHNSITGNFPCLLKNISALQVLILRSNKLYGGLKCPSNSEGVWLELQIFDVAHNELTGELPGNWVTRFQRIMITEENKKMKVLGFSHYYEISYNHASLTKDKFYRYTVTMTFKGQEMEVPKILTIFTCIDVSSNSLRGTIPEEFRQLQALYVLNLSNNALVGQIPSSIGDLRNLESLDMSWNKLSGAIPVSLAQLNFLQSLNLSFNQLVGRVPKGTQMQTFLEDSFFGNEGLCDLPLKRKCSAEEESHDQSEEEGGRKIDWNVLSIEVGFVVGLASIVAPLVWCPRWRWLYFECVDEIAVRILPRSVARIWFRLTNT